MGNSQISRTTAESLATPPTSAGQKLEPRSIQTLRSCGEFPGTLLDWGSTKNNGVNSVL